MTPLTAIRSVSGPCYWVSPDDLKEWARRAKVLEQAKAGDQEALAEVRDSLGLRTWIHRGKTLILDGILVAGKP